MTSEASTPASATMNDDKLSDQLIIKAQLGDDIRKMMIHNEDLTLNELVLMMERIFTGKISNSDELTIKYLDDDGDKVTLLNDSDLTVALNFHKVLRLFVNVNGTEQNKINSAKDSNQSGDFIDEKTFRSELQSIRNSVQTILDRLQLSTNDVLDAKITTHEIEPHKQSSAAAETSQLNTNHFANHEPYTVNATQVQPTDTNKIPQTQVPTSHFVPTAFKNEQDARTNTFGPPPTTFPNVPPLPNSTVPRFPPASNPTSNAPPTNYSPNMPPTPANGQQPAAVSPPLPPQQGGFYGHQQNLYQQRPSYPNYPINNVYPPQQPTTNNVSFPHSSPPPQTAAQQSYGAYPAQTSYYNPGQQYPQS
ncbi:hypothetical protein I4U23_024265 [Adineta vaga]|nr:hypothetical protein I4U23_024265 [Adineta vaga]